jgi:hypothetical protein
MQNQSKLLLPLKVHSNKFEKPSKRFFNNFKTSLNVFQKFNLNETIFFYRKKSNKHQNYSLILIKEENVE